MKHTATLILFILVIACYIAGFMTGKVARQCPSLPQGLTMEMNPPASAKEGDVNIGIGGWHVYRQGAWHYAEFHIGKPVNLTSND